MMKLGADNKKEVAIMAVLFAVAVVVGVYNFRDVLWAKGAEEIPSPSASPAQQSGPATVTAAQDNEPRINFDILERSREVIYEAGNRNLFAYAPPPPSIDYDVKKTATPAPTPYIPTPTPVPPIPLKFYGFANKQSEPKRVFLGAADGRNFVAGLNEIVDRRYKVVQMQANQVVIEDMLTGDRQPVLLTPR